MKKIIALFTVLFILSGLTAYAEPEELKSSDGQFIYTSRGVITAFLGGTVITVPSEIDGTAITEIGTLMCYGKNITTVMIENGITSIGVSAFEDCDADYVQIPGTVTVIDEAAFRGCKSLASVTLEDPDLEFGKDAFANTGHISFAVPCTFDRAKLTGKLSAAKGDDNFDFILLHSELTELPGEKDIFGDTLSFCQTCGTKVSPNFGWNTLPFADVLSDSWYYTYVGIVFDAGIMNGKSETAFDPDAGLTVAEAAKIAAVIHAKQTWAAEEFAAGGEHWYDVYVNYCRRNEIIDDDVNLDWEKSATRAEMAYIFSRCDTDIVYINEVTTSDIPDVSDETDFSYEILELYNRGIAVGSDAAYTFYPDTGVKRSEAAAIVSRILNPRLRIALPKN